MHYAELNVSLLKKLLVIGIVVILTGCATSTSVQWWRVGNCLVIYDEREENRQMIVAGQQCDIKREELPRGHGMAHSSSPWR